MMRRAYLDAAAAVVDLLADPAVSTSWTAQSALAGFTVSGLAGHLARQVTRVSPVVAEDAPAERPITLLEHYARARWVGADTDADVNVKIRRDGEAEAADGPEALVDRTATAVKGLRQTLPNQLSDRSVYLPWGPWSLTLDDFLLSRMLEIVVHCDDLAYSVGVDVPPLSPAVVDQVIVLLARLAVQRHGATAVLRALSRTERAPATVAAI